MRDWSVPRSAANDVKVRIKASPNARTSELVGWEDDPLAGRILRVRIAAAPSDGKANAELTRFLAKILKLPKSAVVLEKGTTSRIKTVVIPDAAFAALERELQ